MYNLYKYLSQETIALITMLVLLLPYNIVIKKIIRIVGTSFATRFGSYYSRLYHQYKIRNCLINSLLCIYIVLWYKFFRSTNFLGLIANSIVSTCVIAYIGYSVTKILVTTLDIIVSIYETKLIAKHVPINLHAQVLKFVIIACTSIISVSYILDISIGAFFTSLGAAAALLTFIFKDTFTGLIAGLQLTIQDIIRIGDPINVPQYNIDGNVEAITINTVKIRNFDKSISTIPTSSLLTASIKNWRAMIESGGRRIKRSIYINTSTISFCTQELLLKLHQIPNFSASLAERLKSNHSGDVTNMELFRIYVVQYLSNNSVVQFKGSEPAIIVRELEPLPTAIPVEISMFVEIIDSAQYENVQANIFNHLLAIVPKFDLQLLNSQLI